MDLVLLAFTVLYNPKRVNSSIINSRAIFLKFPASIDNPLLCDSFFLLVALDESLAPSFAVTFFFEPIGGYTHHHQ
jgi:hypothetical protein